MLGIPIWVFYLLVGIIVTGAITGWIKNAKFRKEMSDLIMEILLAFQDGAISADEVARILKEAKDVYDAITTIKERRVAMARASRG